MLGETEARELETGRPDRSRRSRTAILRAHSRGATIAALVGLATASTALRAIVVGHVHGPLVFMDELGYERMAQSFAHTGYFSLFGKTGLAYSPLYPIVLSPIYALTSSLQTAYEWAKVENAVLISLSVFPFYGIARFELRRDRALAAAALSLLAPLMLYSGFEMSESLAYPLCLAAIWTMLRAVRRPGAWNDAALLGAIVLASAARLELIVLVPAALTAVLLVAVLGQERTAGRTRAALGAIWAHRLLFGAAAVALVAVLVRTASNGGDLPLAGRYANLARSHVDPLRVLELFLQHLAELDFAVGVIPFAAALLAAYALVRFGLPRGPLVFASVALATTFWILLEVAFTAAKFDATSLKPHLGAGATDLPRIHERYLIYLVPLFVVALFAALPLLRDRIPLRYHLAIAVAVAALPAAIPFGTVINNTNGVDSFALQIFAKQLPEKVVPVSHATLLILFLSIFAAFIYLCAAVQPLPQLAVAMTALAFLGLSAVELGRQTQRISAAAVGLPAHADWVDRVVGGRRDVALVAGAGVRPLAVKETAFANSSITRVYRTCKVVLGADFGEQQLTLDPSGVLRLPSGPIQTRYAVVPAAFHAPGRVLGRDPAGHLVLLAVKGETLWLPPDRRSLLSCAD
jgi:Dolichyl-phosphate-mannose-protein mannosyltransferase